MKQTNIIQLDPKVIAFLEEQPLKLLIGGEWRPAVAGGTFPVYDPSQGKVIAHVAAAEAADVDLAVKAARRAFLSPDWADLTPAERTNRIWRLAELVERDAEFMAQLDSLNAGLPLQVTRGVEGPVMAGDLRYYAGWASKLHGQSIPVNNPGRLVYTLREPMGVCGAIVAWNYPMIAISGKLGPALACGNTVVLKPAEQAPLSALWFGRLAEEAGFPPGVINIVTGFGETAGAAITSHPDVNKVGFTGSTEVGRKIIQASAGNIKRVSLELGGKSPSLIFADANLEEAIEGSLWGIFNHSGQVCTAGSRLFVERRVLDHVLEGLVAKAKAIRVGPALDPDTQAGPLVSKKQLERVEGFIQAGLASGARLCVGGGRPEGVPEDGYFLSPTVFTDVPGDHSLACQEIFGPVLVVAPFDSWEEVMQKANAIPYGLAATIWTGDMERAIRFSRQAQAGIIWINGHGLYDSSAPYGGYKQSGYGREMGEASLDEYTQVKTVWM